MDGEQPPKFQLKKAQRSDTRTLYPEGAIG